MINPRERSIITCIILTIITCGFYGLYWLYCIAEDIYNSGAPDAPQATPGMVILLDILTCGIYGIYCMYKWGKAIQQMYNIRGWNGEDRSLIYLLLTLFRLEIIAYALIQDDLNRIAQLPPPPMNPGQGGAGYGGGSPYTASNEPYYAPGQNPQQAYAPQGQPAQPQQQTYAPQPPQDSPPPPNSPYNP